MRTRICERGLWKPTPRRRPEASATWTSGASPEPSRRATAPEKTQGCPSRTALSRPGCRMMRAVSTGGSAEPLTVRSLAHDERGRARLGLAGRVRESDQQQVLARLQGRRPEGGRQAVRLVGGGAGLPLFHLDLAIVRTDL